MISFILISTFLVTAFSQPISFSPETQTIEPLAEDVAGIGQTLGFNVGIDGDWLLSGSAGAWAIFYKRNASDLFERTQKISSGVQAYSVDLKNGVALIQTSSGFAVYTESGGTWSTSYTIPRGGGSVTDVNNKPMQSCALSADATRAIIGKPAESGGGGAWFFHESGGTWTQQGAKYTITGQTKHGEYVAISADGTVAASCDSGTNGASNGAHKCNIYKWTGSAWVISDVLDTPSGYTVDDFGAACAVSDDGSVVFVGQMGTSASIGYVHIFEETATDTWTVVQTITGPVGDIFGGRLAFKDNRLVVGAWLGDNDLNGCGDVRVYYQLSNGQWTSQGQLGPDACQVEGTNERYGVSVGIDGDVIVAGARYYDAHGGLVAGRMIVWDNIPNFPTAAPTQSPTPPTPAPTQSPTVSPTIVVGKAEIKYNVKDGAGRASIAQDTITDVKAKYTDPSDLEVRVKSTEVSTNPKSTYDAVGNKTLYEESYAKARGCYPDCTAVVTVGGRRMLESEHRELQSGGTIEIEITFDLSEAAYNELIADGNNLDDANFTNDLASELGVHPDNITVTVTDGEVVVEVSLLAQVTDEPSGEETIDALQEIQASLDNATQVLVDEFDEPGSSVTTVSLDLCGSRDCSGFGDGSAPDTDDNGCNTLTGICVCNDDRWGINCESECECNNGGYCSNNLCHCDYPYYGLRCDDTIDCSC